MSEPKRTRNEDMKRLRFEEGKSNTEISILYGVSRERVRQIIGNTGSDFRRKWTEKRADGFDLSLVDDVNDLPGISNVWKSLWGKFRHKAKGGHIKTGQRYEEIASKILLSKGISNTLMPTHHPFDILLHNGLRVDVKHSTFDLSYMESQKCVSPTYRISNTKYGKECDFFFVFIPYNDGYVNFIIPSRDVSTSDIRIVFPQQGRKASKWAQYLDAFDALI